MYDLLNFTVADMVTFSKKLRNVGDNAESMEEVSGKIVRHIYENIFTNEKERPLALVRLFVSIPIGELPSNLQVFAENILGHKAISPKMKCLTLMGTTGAHKAWNMCNTSLGHQAIPLESEAIVNSFPMVSGLITQFGMRINKILKPDLSSMMYDNLKTYNIFHVLEAKNSPLFPAQQEFIIPEKIRSVIAFGGLLPSGNLFTVIAFSRVVIPRKVVDMFRPLTLSIKAAILPYENKIFNVEKL